MCTLWLRSGVAFGLAVVWTAVARGQETCERFRDIPFPSPTPEFADEIGKAVAADGLHAAVGAPGHDAGVVYPYRFVAGVGWERLNEITAPDPANENQFGRSVSLSGNTLVIGSTGNGYVYEYDSGWSQVAILDAGFRVAVDGDIAVVDGPGNVLVYDRNQGGPEAWGLITEIPTAAEKRRPLRRSGRHQR